MSFKQLQAELETLIQKHGVGTFLFVIKDPDSDLEAYASDGSLSWIVGAARQMARMAENEQDAMQDELDTPAGAD